MFETNPRNSGLKHRDIVSEIVYGPISTRRFGLSLGINLLPARIKLCNFDCLYCQFGWTRRRVVLNELPNVAFPPLGQVEDEIASQFKDLSRQMIVPDTIVFSGNGEPTLHPAFAEASAVVRKYRDCYLPQARIGILTNGTGVSNPGVFQAINQMDLKSVKLDAGLEWMDRPFMNCDLDALVPLWGRLSNLTIQSFFSEGRFDNTRPECVDPWIERIRKIHPRRVHIYTLDRVPAVPMMQKASLDRMTHIGRQLANRSWVDVQVFG